jgi:uncharacterized protein (DUF362 family)
MRDFFIEVNENSFYPNSYYNYNPDSLYPEYIWSNVDISNEKNHIYEMVRNCLIGLKMDADNFNTENWNPFREFIKEGDTVVIKPNWVLHYNKNKKITHNSLECLITHPSVVRAITDYCLLALNGTGRIIIGDAPMQGCDLDRLIKVSGYENLFSFYNQRSIKVFPVDFRQFSTVVDNNKVLIGRKFNSCEGLMVELNSGSKLYSEIPSAKKYKVSDYNEKVTNMFHQNGRHAYLINKEVLSADVVVNLCKPKCHRLAGMTAAVKNFVGITFDKACLPHRTVGSSHQGGDEYLYSSLIKSLISRILDMKIYFEEQNRLKLSLIMRYTYALLYYISKGVSKDRFLIGSWYGNDTVWRTVLDLYNILLYADKTGIIQHDKQRKVFNMADMIISGEGNGPVSPEPKNLGIIIAGNDAIMMDRLVCGMMGFDYLKVPSVYHGINDLQLIGKESGDYLFYSNNLNYNGMRIEELNFPLEWRFKPYDTWKGYIEKAV